MKEVASVRNRTKRKTVIVVDKTPFEMPFFNLFNSFVTKVAAYVEPSIKEEQAYIIKLDEIIEDLEQNIKRKMEQKATEDIATEDRFLKEIELISKDFEKAIEKYQIKVRQDG